MIATQSKAQSGKVVYPAQLQQQRLMKDQTRRNAQQKIL